MKKYNIKRYKLKKFQFEKRKNKRQEIFRKYYKEYFESIYLEDEEELNYYSYFDHWGDS